MKTLFHVRPNQSEQHYIIEGKDNAINFARNWRKNGAAPVFVYTTHEVSFHPGVLFPDDFVYCAD